jgi:hypothetical protein
VVIHADIFYGRALNIHCLDMSADACTVSLGGTCIVPSSTSGSATDGYIHTDVGKKERVKEGESEGEGEGEDEDEDTHMEADIVSRSVKLALLKALGIMMNSKPKLSESCLCASLIGARILTAHEIPFDVQTGYMHMAGFSYSIPHVWLVNTLDGAITDLTFSQPERKVVLMNQGYTFYDGPSDRASYDLEPKYALLPKALPIGLLREKASNLEKYIRDGPENVKAVVATVMKKALDGSQNVTFTMEVAVDHGSN